MTLVPKKEIRVMIYDDDRIAGAAPFSPVPLSYRAPSTFANCRLRVQNSQIQVQQRHPDPLHLVHGFNHYSNLKHCQ